MNSYHYYDKVIKFDKKFICFLKINAVMEDKLKICLLYTSDAADEV